MKRSTHCLVLLLADEPTGCAIEGRNDGDLRLGGVRFSGISDSGLEFHDWLRGKTPGTVIGLRVWPNEEEELWRREVQRRPYIDSSLEDGVRIWFASAHECDEEKSCDQSFLFNRTFRSSDGEVALLVDLKWVTTEEESDLLSRIQPLKATWIAS